MKSTYIYLNIYRIKETEYLYVGSHTWDGPLGVVDPSYSGSSTVAINHKMQPIEIRVLESFTGGDFNSLKKESMWINKYAAEVGIAQIACYNLGEFKPTEWQLKYKIGGKLLNKHANTMENAIVAAAEKEVRRRAVQSRILSGKDNYKDLNSIASVPEVRHRAVATAIANGSMQRMVNAMHTKEARMKSKEIQKKLGLTKKSAAIATEAWVAKSRHYEVDGFIGTLKQCCTHLGLNLNSVKHYAKGWDPFTYKGIKFNIVYAT